MEKRISDFVKLKEQLVEVCHDFMRQEQSIKSYNDFSFLTQKVSREKANADLHSTIEEKELLKTRLSEALKTLSKDELSEIIRADLRTCIDNETANPLLWICGLDLKELPMSISFIGSPLGVEYSPDVWIGIGTNAEGLYFSVETAEDLWHSDSFDLHDMKKKFLRTLETAKDAKGEIEGEELTDEDHDEGYCWGCDWCQHQSCPHAETKSCTEKVRQIDRRVYERHKHKQHKRD